MSKYVAYTRIGNEPIHQTKPDRESGSEVKGSVP